MQARDFFGSEARGSADAPEVIGFYSNGCVAGAQALPETGPTWQAMRLSRNRNWGHPELDRLCHGPQPAGRRHHIVERPLRGRHEPAARRPDANSSHVSHQNGLDVDIWMLPARDLNLSVEARESLSSISMRSQRGAWIRQLDRGSRAGAAPCRQRPTGRAHLRRHRRSRSGFAGTRPGTVTTSTGSGPSAATITISTCGSPVLPGRATCEEQEPPEPGDGCAEAEARREAILNPPPPVPDDGVRPPPGPPRGNRVTLGQVPRQCLTLLSGLDR
jgi:penicillin-insensitive murein endopeptidase